jgi:hypothetical protein
LLCDGNFAGEKKGKPAEKENLARDRARRLKRVCAPAVSSRGREGGRISGRLLAGSMSIVHSFGRKALFQEASDCKNRLPIHF